MFPGAVVTVAAVLVVAGHLIRWSIESGRFPTRPSASTPTSATPAREPSAAVLSYVVSGADGAPCRVLDVSAAATGAELVDLGAVSITERHEHDVVLAISDPDAWVSMLPHQQLVARHLRSRAWRPSRDRSRSAVVSTGTLAAAPPSRWWWARFRSAIAAQARAAGYTNQRVAPISLQIPAAIGALTALIAVVTTVTAIIARDLARIDIWWLAVGCAGAALTAHCVFSLLEPADVLTPVGMSMAIVASRRLEHLTATTTSGDRLGSRPDLAVAVALGLPTAVTRELPLTSTSRERRIWSMTSGTTRVVRIRRLWLPGEGARPGFVIAGGIGGVIATTVIRSVVAAIRDTDWVTDLEQSVPDALGPLDQHLSTVASLALVPLALSVVAVVVGLIDLMATREVSGVVIDIRLPLDDTLAGRARQVIVGGNHNGVALIELAVDDGEHETIHPLLVDARAGAPIGAQVTVRLTRILRRVRTITPIGTSGAMATSGPSLGT